MLCPHLEEQLSAAPPAAWTNTFGGMDRKNMRLAWGCRRSHGTSRYQVLGVLMGGRTHGWHGLQAQSWNKEKSSAWWVDGRKNMWMAWAAGAVREQADFRCLVC